MIGTHLRVFDGKRVIEGRVVQVSGGGEGIEEIVIEPKMRFVSTHVCSCGTCSPEPYADRCQYEARA